MNNNLNDIIDLMNELKAVTDKQVESMKPTTLLVGTVETIDPLTVRVSDKLILDADDLLLSTNVINHNEQITVHHQTENKEKLGVGDNSFESHLHDYEGTKRFFILQALSVGEKVLLLRVQGGKQYYIMDRVRYANDNDTD